ALPLGPRGLTLVRLDGEAAQHLQRARSDLTPVGRGVLAGELPVVSVSHRGHTVRPVTGGDGAGREVRVAPEVRVDARSGLQYEVVEQVVLSVDVSDAAVLVPDVHDFHHVRQRIFQLLAEYRPLVPVAVFVLRGQR